jgi:UDP-N-acetylmuramate dehydrogenase
MTVWEDLARRDVPIGPLTTYKLGGPARFLLTVQDEPTLERIARDLAEHPLPVAVLGRGSNVLVSDRGFDGLVIHLGAGFSWVRLDETVRAGSATPLPTVARTSARAGRSGLEFLVGIPGSVGGAVMMNAGCLGSETRDRLVVATVVSLATGRTEALDGAALELSYRHSRLGPLDVVTSAEFSTEPAEPAACEEVIRDVIRWRKQHQPGGILNAGSVFKNPRGDSAGRLIDQAGLKGFSVGGARVSMVHANFIEAGPDATARDVHTLIRSIQDRIRRQYGVELEAEVRFLGRFEEST